MVSFEKHIVYEGHKNLGRSYNAIMETAQEPWVLLLDHDVFLATCKHWYQACSAAIRLCQTGLDEMSEKPKVGLITCRTNRVHMGPQKAKGAPKGDNILEHIRFAKELWQHGSAMVTAAQPPLSGFFMIVNRRAWRDIGGFKPTGFEGVDYDFTRRLHAAGWELWLMRGVYTFHLWKKAKAGELWNW